MHPSIHPPTYPSIHSSIDPSMQAMKHEQTPPGNKNWERKSEHYWGTCIIMEVKKGTKIWFLLTETSRLFKFFCCSLLLIILKWQFSFTQLEAGIWFCTPCKIISLQQNYFSLIKSCKNLWTSDNLFINESVLRVIKHTPLSPLPVAMCTCGGN